MKEDLLNIIQVIDKNMEKYKHKDLESVELVVKYSPIIDELPVIGYYVKISDNEMLLIRECDGMICSKRACGRRMGNVNLLIELIRYYLRNPLLEIKIVNELGNGVLEYDLTGM